MISWCLGLIILCLGSTAFAQPLLYLSKDSNEAVALGDSLHVPATGTLDAADQLTTIGLKPGQTLWAEDRDHDVFKATALSAILDADGQFLVKVEVENRQPGFDLFLHRTKPTRKGGGKGFHVEKLMQAKETVLQKISVWLSDYLNREVFRIQDYGTGYDYEQFHLPLPGGKLWLVCYTYTEDSGKTVAKINLARIQEKALPSLKAVTILASMDGYFLDHWQWMDANHNRKPDIRVNTPDGFSWKQMEVNGTTMSLLFGPAKVVKDKAKAPEAPKAKQPANP